MIASEPECSWWAIVIYLRQVLLNICAIVFKTKASIQAASLMSPNRSDCVRLSGSG
jgi:hypothetical protein